MERRAHPRGMSGVASCFHRSPRAYRQVSARVLCMVSKGVESRIEVEVPVGGML